MLFCPLIIFENVCFKDTGGEKNFTITFNCQKLHVKFFNLQELFKMRPSARMPDSNFSSLNAKMVHQRILVRMLVNFALQHTDIIELVLVDLNNSLLDAWT